MTKFTNTNLRTGHTFRCQVKGGRCPAQTQNGTQCKNRVVLGRRLCHVHRKTRLGLQVKKSTIANAGRGLYTTRDIKKGDVIGRYAGQLISTTMLNDRYGAGKKDNAPYALAASRSAHSSGHKIVDSACLRGIMSMANSKKTRSQSNARFSDQIRKDGTVNVRATKNIHAGNEIFIFYGSGFMKTHKNSKHTTY